MGACNILPRIIGAGRAAELLYTGRTMDGVEAERCGFYNRLCEPDQLHVQAQTLATTLANGPTFAHAVTKRCLHDEWDMDIDRAISAEAEAQALCMDTNDFERAYEAFVAKRQPVFAGD
jgi:enoyl-CoA hydratase/carnithine racemase